MSNKYNIKYLEDKLGPFDTEYQLGDAGKYPRISLIEGSLIYIKKNTLLELKNEIKRIKDDEFINTPTYIWGYVKETDGVHFIRSFGENKVFNYNSSMKGVFARGKLKILQDLEKDTIDELFDQKAVFDYFYKKLWDLRLELGKEIRNKNEIPDNIALMEAQHLIDRIIFTYFICEKSLISEKDHGPISGKELFSDIFGQLPNTWLYLKKLFFEQFAKEDANDLDCGGEVYIKTPYLNGGLFRPKNISGITEEDLEIDYDWNKIFDPLNKYSWIIEDEISDVHGEYEGNLTPEIIGHIYEKFVISIDLLNEIELDELEISESGELTKGNKKIGAYYTPEYITEYISKNVIKPYLYSNLGINIKTNFNDFLNNATPEIMQNSLELLNKITICDPACGSGAFLIKGAEILLNYKLIILKELNYDKAQINKYNIKKEIITKNLYGIDIQEGAVEICKLRLWLWLMSSSDKHIEPLPNIEYNFVVGNSLVGWSEEKLEQNVLVKLDEKAIWILEALKSGYESEQRRVIDEAISLLNETDMESYARAFSILKSLYSYSFGEKAEILKTTIQRIKMVIYEKLDGIFYDNIKSKRVRISFEEYKLLNPVHWKFEFWNIFNESGFDAIIGNPPYLDSEEMVKNQPETRKLYTKLFSTAKGNWDIFCIFIEKSFILLKNNGFFGMIVPNKILSADYAISIRKYLQEKMIIAIRDYTTIPVFQASVYPIVIVAQNGYNKDNKFVAEFMGPFEHSAKLKFDNLVVQNNLKKTPQNTWSHIFDEHAGEIIDKILLKSVLLNELAEVGGAASVSEAYEIQNLIVDSNKLDNSFQFINTGTIDRYTSLWGYKRTRYIKVNYNNPSINKMELKKYSSKRYIESISNKIIIAGMTKVLESYYDENGDVTAGKSTTVVISDDATLKFLIGILNSKFMTFIYKSLFRSLSLQGGYMRVGPPQIKSLPIINPDPSDRTQIISKVESITKLNKKLMEEKRRFKNWLQKNYSIDKLSKKLENYQNLSYNLFAKELKRLNVDISKNPEIVEVEFQRSLELLNRLIESIKMLDDDINNDIFELYGMTKIQISLINENLGGKS